MLTKPESLDDVLDKLNYRVNSCLQIKNMDKRYDSLTKIGLEYMKLSATYEEESKEYKKIQDRSKLYKTNIEKTSEEINLRAKKRGGPFAVAMPGGIGLLVRDQYAIEANLILFERAWDKRNLENSPQSL